MSLPLLRRIATSGQHYVWLPDTKTRKYFGKDPVKAKEAYIHWLAARGGPPAPPPADRATVADVVGVYLRHADQRYTDKRERHRIGVALAAVLELHGPQPAASFRAKALREVRGKLLYEGKKLRSRRYINKLVRSIQTAWRWLATEELVPAEAAASVGLVRALRPGDGGREREPVLPPDPADIAATLAQCPALVADMLRVQLLTGARPGEVCRMKWDEVSRSPDQPVPLPGTGRTVAALKCGETTVWVYAPGSHKTAKRGKSRAVPIGPKAQAVLAGRVADTGLVFATRLGRAYRADSYSKAVTRACRKAGVPEWSPNQLRHACATDLAERFDDHTAASVLGHAAGSTATRVYVEQALRKAAAAAAQVG